MSEPAGPADLGEALPRFATRRRPERPNRLAAARVIAEALGTPLMPWQEHVISVATEYDPKTGRPFYRNVWVTVPRQSGKTLMILVLMLLRGLMLARAKIAYTAQTANDARKKLIEDWKPMLQASDEMWGKADEPKPTGEGLVEKVREQSGSESFTLVNKSLVTIVAGGRSSGHGSTLHFGVIDEAFHDQDLRREQAMIPAQNTIPDAQLIGISTMGDAGSVLLNARVKQGRKAVRDDDDSGMCYFEWSAEPSAELDDEDAWRRCMPALGHTIDLETVRAALKTFLSDPELGPDEFRRAYLNIATSARRTVFPPGLYDELSSNDVAPLGTGRELTLAIDVTPSRESAAIAVADDEHNLELVDHRGGTAWVVERVAEISQRHGNVPVVLDVGGPAGALYDDLVAANVPVIEAGTRDLVNACGQFFDAFKQARLRMREDPALAEAIDKARQRNVADAWAWVRKVGDHDASPLVALSLALWGTGHHPEVKVPAVATPHDVDDDELAAIRERIKGEHAAAAAKLARQG